MLASRAFKSYGSVAQDALVYRRLFEMLADSDLRKQLVFLDIKNPKELCDKIMVCESLASEKVTSLKKTDPLASFFTFERTLNEIETLL